MKRSKDQWWRPSASFERWLYLRSSDYLFLELLHLATWFRQRLRHKPTHYSLTMYHSSHRFIIPALASQLMDLEPNAGYRQMTATYLFASPLDELGHLKDMNVKCVHCVSQREADAPLIWEIPEGALRPSTDEIHRLFSECVPRFKALTSGYSWTSDTWCSWSEQSVTDIDCRVCKAPLSESRTHHLTQ